MKHITLWRGNHHKRERTGQYVLLDDTDYKKAKRWHWTLRNGYAAGHIKEQGIWRKVVLHRYILNAKTGEIVDHKDHNRLNCQRNNLRLCSKSQNGFNRVKVARGKSRFKGVVWKKRQTKSGGKWAAQITANRINIHLGYFGDEQIAALMYDFWALDLHGEFVNTNFNVVFKGGYDNGCVPEVTGTRPAGSFVCTRCGHVNIQETEQQAGMVRQVSDSSQ